MGTWKERNQIYAIERIMLDVFGLRFLCLYSIDMPLPTIEYTSSVRPPVQTHVHFIIDAFVEFLLSDISPPREYPILTNHYCRPLTSGPFILFNIEQLTRPKILKEVLQRALQSDIVEVWDYSEVNVAFLRKYGIAARHVPVQTTSERIQYYKHLLATQPKEFDYALCGVGSDRRLAILQKLQSRNIKVLLLTNVYGEQRDILISRCRFQLNIHQTDDHQIFESVRCDPWLEAGMPILSEVSLDNDPRCSLTSYDKFLENAIEFKKEILKNEYTIKKEVYESKE